MYFIKFIICQVFYDQKPVSTCMTQNIKWTLSPVLGYSFIVFKVCKFNPTERKIHFRDLWSKKKYFQGAEDFFSRIWGDQCIILREQGSIDPLGASLMCFPLFVGVLCLSFVFYALLCVHSGFALVLGGGGWGGERAGCFAGIVLQMYCYNKFSVAFPHDAVGWSAVCDCGIS